MAEETIEKEPVTTPVEDSPKKELDNTTQDLIKEALAGANDQSKPWYKRGLAYVIAVALIVAFYAGDKVGGDVVNTVVQLLQSLLGNL